jgi:arylsulfatase A
MKSTRLLLGLLCAVVGALTLNAVPRQPNIVIFYADDLGYGDLGCDNPASKIPTPNLDRLSTEGVRFTDAHSSSGICTPSRYALLTGRSHWRDFHGIVGAFGQPVFKPGQLTLPGYLRQHGYATAAIGKWHLGFDWDAIMTASGLAKPHQRGVVYQPEDFDWTKPIPGGPLARGFDHFFGFTCPNMPPYTWIEDDHVTAVPSRPFDNSKWRPAKEGTWEARRGPMVANWDIYQGLPTLAAKAVDRVAALAQDGRPFFLYFALPSPHAPIVPLDAYDGRSGAGPYGDFVAQTDAVIGRVLAALAASGEADNTIVIFSADNGPERYAYERDARYGHWSSSPFRGLKRDLYEGGHHIPLIIRFPGQAPAGQVSDVLVSQTDLFATLAAAIGAPLTRADAGAEDSISFLSALLGRPGAGRAAMVHNTHDGYALRQGSWLLIDTPKGHVSKPDPRWLKKHGLPERPDPVSLYNLAADPGQTTNLAALQPRRVTDMQAMLRRLRASTHTTPRLD